MDTCNHELMQMKEDNGEVFICQLCGLELKDMCGKCTVKELLDNGMCLDIPL